MTPSIRPKCSSKGMDYRLDRTNRLLAAGRPRLEGNLEEAWPEAHPSRSQMTEVHGWHRKIFQTIEQAGGILTPHPSELVADAGTADHQCYCGRAFTTAVGLATHRRKAHQIFSAEGATCPACMKHFWSTQRLQQHLAYISRRTGRNEYFQTLMRAGFKAEYSGVTLPVDFLGLDRANWIQAYEPHSMPTDRRITQIAQREQEVLRLDQHLAQSDVPSTGAVVQCAFFEQLTRSTQVWLSDFQNAGFDAQAIVCLSDRWTDVIAITLEELQTDNSASHADRWLEKCFLQWGQHELGELIANFEDGEAEHIADDEFAEFAQEFSTTKDQARVRFYAHAFRPSGSKIPITHRPSNPHVRSVGRLLRMRL